MGLLDFIIKVAVDANGVRKGTEDVKAQFSAMSAHVAGELGKAFSVGAVFAFTKQIAAAALENKHLAEQLDTTAEMIEKIKKAASKSGLEEEGFFKIIDKLRVLQDDAGGGSQKALDQLKKYKLTLHEISGEGHNAADALVKIGENMRGMDGEEVRAAFTRDFGKKSGRYAEAAGKIGSQSGRYSDPDMRTAVESIGETFKMVASESMNIAAKVLASTVLGFQRGLDIVFGTNFSPRAPGSAFVDATDEAKEKAGLKRDIMRARAGLSAGTDSSEEDYYQSLDVKAYMDAQKPKTRHRNAARDFETFSDSLSQIGGFIGSGTGSPAAQRSLDYQERTARAVEEMRSKLDQGVTF